MMLKENALTQQALNIAPLQYTDYILLIVLSRHRYRWHHPGNCILFYGLILNEKAVTDFYIGL